MPGTDSVSAEGDGQSTAMAREAVPVTIRRVAKLAKVSPATVSRVINGRTSVDPALAERVKHTIESLGYSPSSVAQSLARGRTGLVAILVPDLANPMFQSVLHGVSDMAAREEHRLLVADSHETPHEESILAREARLRCDGLVLCSPRMSDEELRELAPRVEPLVLVNRRVDGVSVPTVSIDYASGMRALAAHAVSLGHTRIAYLSGPESSTANRERLEALQEAAVGRFDLAVVPCGSMHADGFDAADRALATGSTAIVGYNDLVAFGALGRLYEVGIDVPGKVSVAGVDDITFARYCAPPLTTVSVPQEELGRQAWQRLSAMLQGDEPPADVRFSPRLEVRGSTGPAAQ